MGGWCCIERKVLFHLNVKNSEGFVVVVVAVVVLV